MLGRQNFQRLRELLKYIVSYRETRHSAIVTRYNALLATLNHIEDYIKSRIITKHFKQGAGAIMLPTPDLLVIVHALYLVC
jgi:hypothetical protein